MQTLNGYTMDQKFLDLVTKENDLGVLIDEEVKSHTHIPTATSKADHILATYRAMWEGYLAH